MVAVVEAGRIVSLEADPGNPATGVGICLKGLSHIERVYSAERILEPLLKEKRHSTKGAAIFKPISWSHAIDLICQQLRHHRDTYGPQSIFYYTASGQKGLLNGVGMNFFNLFGGCTTKYGDLCWQAGLEATRLTLGANKHNAPWDIAHADLILLWGKNPAETNIQQMQFIYEAIDNGGRLVVIDPRRTQSAERAERLLQLRPGTDGALALGIANWLIENDCIDKAFIERHLLGFDAFREYVRAFSLDKTAGLTDLPAAEIEKLARMIARSKRMTICCGFGLQRFTNSGQALRAIIALLAIMGQIGRPGAGWLYANLQSAIFDTIPAPLSAYPPEEKNSMIRTTISTARLGEGMLALEDPPLKMAIVSRGNPVTQNPHSGLTLEAFRQLNFRVTIEHFMTDTALESDLVLPGASMFEQTDITTGYWHPYIQIRQKLIEPVGEAKSESEIFYMLARGLGISDEEMAGLIPKPTDAAVEAFLEDRLKPFDGLTLERLKQGPVLSPGYEEVAFADGIFPTPSGKIELFSAQARAWWGVAELPEFVPPKETLDNNGAPQGPYPLQLLTPNTKNRIHSQFNNLANIRQFSKTPYAQINPADAGRRRISDGDRVRVFNDRGSLVVDARIEPAIRSGCVCVHNGWWLSEGGGVNLCSKGRETDMGYGAAFHDNRVQMEKA
jgi:anaerobic selenocysteine-containing dehydrogenase